MRLRVQASIQSLRGEVASLKGSLAERDKEIERWSKEAAKAQEAVEQGHGAAQELANQANAPWPRPCHHYHIHVLSHSASLLWQCGNSAVSWHVSLAYCSAHLRLALVALLLESRRTDPSLAWRS